VKDYEIIVEGMHCEGCENLINLTLKEMGAVNASSDHKSGVVKASFSDEIEVELLKKKMKS
jgi:copper chaperone CopZ